MIAELEAVAQKHGYKLADLTGGKKAKVASRTKYKHPEDSSLTWSGRGRQPTWIKDELSTGKSLIDFAMALLHKSRHEDSLYESSVIAGGYEQLDTYEV